MLGSKDIQIRSKVYKDTKLIFTVTISKTAETNPTCQTIVFTIRIDDKYPESHPFVGCLTNVSFYSNVVVLLSNNI